MSPIVLFVVLLVAGISMFPLSRNMHGIPKVLLTIIALVMTVLSAFGVLTSIL